MIIVSGMGDEDKDIAQSLGATAFLAKPFELSALVSAVESSGLFKERTEWAEDFRLGF